MKKILISLSFFVMLFLVTSVPSFAQYGQYGQYGQTTPSQSIFIDKQVGRPVGVTKGGVTEVEYVDNLTISDTRFKPGAEVDFKIRVKNTSTVTLNSVTVTDTVPAYIEPIEGPGTYNASTRVITFNAGSFAPNEEKVYFLKTQLYGQDKLPSDKGLMCITNYAKAYNDNVSDDDTAQFCIEKEVIGVKQAPKAGPELNFLVLASQMGLLGIGVMIKKKAK